MENQEETNEIPQETKLVVSEEMRSHFYEIAKWANFLAIIGFVVAGFTIISAFTVGAVISTNPQMSAMASKMGPGASVAFTIAFLIVAFAIFYPSLLLFKYATKAKLGVLYGEQASLNEAMGKLKSIFKYWGIITIIYIGLNIFMFLAQMAGKA